MVVLPLPVRPSNPRTAPGATVKDRSWRTESDEGRKTKDESGAYDEDSSFVQLALSLPKGLSSSCSGYANVTCSNSTESAPAGKSSAPSASALRWANNSSMRVMLAV